MRHIFSKIALIILIGIGLQACNTVKRVAENELLLTNNAIYVDSLKNKTETLHNLLIQKPNRSLLGIPLRLHTYNLARPNIDSIIAAKYAKNPNKTERLKQFLSEKQFDQMLTSKRDFNSWLKRIGEAPVIIDTTFINKSLELLNKYYINHGWFNVKSDYNIKSTKPKRAEITYNINPGKRYYLRTIKTKIDSPIIDSIYQIIKSDSEISINTPYQTKNFEAERNRVTNELRNRGLYHFGQEYLFFELDTLNPNKNIHVELQIRDRSFRIQDSIYTEPFKVYTIKNVNIFTQTAFQSANSIQTDSVSLNGFNVYSQGKLKYKPKTLINSIFITPNEVFKDIDRARTYRKISDLKTFKYPRIEYIENQDSTLTTNIYLNPLKKYELAFSAEISQSNIQSVGFSINPSLSVRNIFHGAETLQLSAFTSIGASKDNASGTDSFFDITEFGIDLNITIPRLFSPFNTSKIIPKHMYPTTRFGISASGQTNIGLDKQTVSGSLSYRWFPSESVNNKLDFFNIQYIRNLNTDNYFGVYQNSYNTLNSISIANNYQGTDLIFPSETNQFIADVLTGNTDIPVNSEDFVTVSNINERKTRLTEDNFIMSSSFNYVKDKRDNLLDKNFSIFRTRFEIAGNALSGLSSLLNSKKDESGRHKFFGVAYSQYFKTELDYIKYFDLGQSNVLALRSYFGIAIPYGNSYNIPFSRSFFAGGANDNRAWGPYSLGPGKTKSIDEFNEANLKIAFSLENRFNIFGYIYGALFIDVGNIWNVLDDATNPDAIFNGFESLKDVAIGTGTGLRYDFTFFVFRFDVGFKTYNPAKIESERWFTDFSLTKATFNFGINYPF